MANTTSNRAIKIEDLQEKFNIGESNLLIVEDDLDTKKSTIRELKKSFSGDYLDPSRYYYYSSQHIEDLLKTINILIAGKAPKDIVENLKNQLDELILSESEGTNPDITKEVQNARVGYGTLANRFTYERNLSNALYVTKTIKNIEGSQINIDKHNGLLTVIPIPINNPISEAKGYIRYYSKNRFNINSITENNAVKKNDSCGFKYTQTDSILKIELPVGYRDNNKTVSCESGKYYLTGDIKFSNSFKDKEIMLEIKYDDGSIDSVPYNYSSLFEFTARHSFTSLVLVFNEDNYAARTYVEFSNIMLSKYILSDYISFEYAETPQLNYFEEYSIINNDYIFEFSLPNSTLQISYYDHTITLDSVNEKIDILDSLLNDKIDRCGLMMDYGTYHPFDSCAVISSDNSGEVLDADKLYDRNGFTSKKIKIKNDTEDFEVKQILTNMPDQIESVSLCFYIDKLTIEKLTAEGGISLILCSDDPEYYNINNYQVTIRRSEMVHGWNVIKKHISEFTAMLNPDIYSIKSATVSVLKNERLIGQEIYINSICFNQKMKPTVILSFDGTYEGSYKNEYNYLVQKNIPATVLLNSSREIDASEFNNLIELMLTKGWDIGSYGNIANRQYEKEILQIDDNYRNQYIGLRMNKEYLQENVIYNPISYSAPYGNLRPITVPLLKELGYKIARTESDSFVSIFTEKDFAIPMTLISNATYYEVKDEKTNQYEKDYTTPYKDKIDYAIRNNVAVSLFARDITEDGDELVAKRATFESIIDYISERVNKGELQVLTMADFYHKCIE